MKLGRLAATANDRFPANTPFSLNFLYPRHSSDHSVQNDPEFMILAIAIVGTTITPWMQFYLQSSIAEKGLSKKHYKLTRIDVVTGCLLTDIIAFFIIVACAATLFPAGMSLRIAQCWQ